MSDSLFLSRLTLKRSPEIGPLIRVLRPDDEARAIATDHRLLWSTMPEAVQSARKDGEAAFLWRREEGGRYYLLGPRPRADSALFSVESKPFEAALAPGDRLRFVLRVNATVDRRAGGREGTKTRSDVAMDLLRSVPPKEEAPGRRAAERQALARQAAWTWLSAQGGRSGFAILEEELSLAGYRAAQIERRGARPARVGVFDLAGLLTVRDPGAFLLRLRVGFGRAKAFGCGLMLVRRAGAA